MKIASRRLRGLVAAAVAVSAIAVPVITALPASANTELTFWSWRTEDKAFYEGQIAKFEAKNPGIKVKFTPYLNTEYNAIVSTALTAGKVQTSFRCVHTVEWQTFLTPVTSWR